MRNADQSNFAPDSGVKVLGFSQPPRSEKGEATCLGTSGFVASQQPDKTEITRARTRLRASKSVLGVDFL